MTPEKWAALLSAFAGISVLVAGFFQWYDTPYNGGPITRPWVKVMFVILIAVQAVALFLALSA
jgi:hypothetical protein